MAGGARRTLARAHARRSEAGAPYLERSFVAHPPRVARTCPGWGYDGPTRALRRKNVRTGTDGTATGNRTTRHALESVRAAPGRYGGRSGRDEGIRWRSSGRYARGTVHGGSSADGPRRLGVTVGRSTRKLAWLEFLGRRGGSAGRALALSGVIHGARNAPARADTLDGGDAL